MYIGELIAWYSAVKMVDPKEKGLTVCTLLGGHLQVMFFRGLSILKPILYFLIHILDKMSKCTFIKFVYDTKNCVKFHFTVVMLQCRALNDFSMCMNSANS